MNFIHQIVNKMTPILSRKNTAVILASLMVVTIAGILVPNQKTEVRAVDVTCANGPTDNRPHLNTFPVKWNGTNSPVQNSDGTWTCYDFPFMVGRNMNGNFPTSQNQHQNGVNVAAGDTVQIRLYIHNTAPANSGDATTANNVSVTTSFTNGAGQATVRASAHADNAPETPSGQVKVNLPANSRLELIDDSGVIQHYDGAYGRTGFQLGDNTVTLFQSLEGCFEKSKFVYYKFRVVQDVTPTGDLQITKEVRNITRNTSFADQTSATVNDSLEYRIRVNATTAPVTNVTVTDTGVNGISMTSGTLRLNGQTISGSLSSGVLLPNVNTTVVQTITYQARVTSTQCNAYLVNTARAQATGVSPVQDTATVVTECAPPAESPVCIPDSQTVDINQTAYFSASQGNGSFTWSAPGSTNTSGTGSAFQTSYTASGTKTVTVTSNGRSDTCTVIVRQPPVENQVVCTPDTQTVDINQTAYFSASQGNGSYVWQASGGNPSIGNNSTFNTQYSTAGTKTVTVTSNGRSDTCTVIVRQPPVENQVICSPDTQTVDVNQYAYFNATFGNNVYAWQAPGGSPSTGDGPSFNTRYSTSGTKIVTVTSNGRSDTCTVIVREIDNPVECIPDFQTTDVDERVDFRATGGNGSYFWQASGGSPSTGDNISFNTRYSSSGLKTVSVTSGNRTDYCSVQVRDDNNDNDAELEITKSVRNLTNGGSFRQSVDAEEDDRVEFEIIVENTGNEEVRNIRIRDIFPDDELELDEDSVEVDNDSYDIDSDSDFEIDLDDLDEGDEVRITFEARVITDNDDSIRNLARATSSNADTVEDDAFVRVDEDNNNDDNPRLQLSKRVRNERTGQDGTSVSAERGDYLTYTLTVRNTGTGTENNFDITDNLSGILAFAEIVDTNGGKLRGDTITWEDVDIRRGQTVTKTFRVRIKTNLNSSQSFVLDNTYGNSVTVTVPGFSSIPFIAPKTGSSGTSAAVFAGLLTSGFVAFRKRRQLLNLIFV